ncbi:MAG: shikimate dehydrogenase [Sphingomonadales bacterium]
MIPTGSARLAGVVGWPVSHSRSPRLHGYWLDRYRIDGLYMPLAVAPRDFETALRALPVLGFKGVNVTVPHKEQACHLVDRIDPWARRVGAVNTITIAADGALTGSNTDGYGFLENLKTSRPDWRAGDGPAVVIGAGGAARAIVAAMAEAGSTEIRLVNRTRKRAEALALALNYDCVSIHDWKTRAAIIGGASVVVNTTVLGMTGKPPLDLALDDLKPDAVVADIVYAPLETPLLAAARARGNPVADGLGMLLHQARPGFKSWFRVEPEVTTQLRDFVAAGPG